MDEANELRGSLQLIGTVKSVIFQNEENGYTVLRLDVGGDEPVTVVGCLPFAAPGEGLTVEGAWERHPSHGEQFKASSAMRSLPVGEKHIYEYLASGAVRGIGPATAAVLVNRFGSHTLEILSDSPEKLAEIKGISARRARDISETFRRQTGMRLLMEFLAANGLKPEYAMRLYKLYGDGALELVKSNPYVIALADSLTRRTRSRSRSALRRTVLRASPRRSFLKWYIISITATASSRAKSSLRQRRSSSAWRPRPRRNVWTFLPTRARSCRRSWQG